ncbi:hypothetical protein VIGAN_11204900 [Vigna angularis var. angularis]|uniref:Uncharacterized protein n=1 Tax=Vigna angularis var. angularis TaxID=157739 RepID=A0A0S3TBE2_PHAAN|nr:hypothetical protein VIGAN_11204900 [Vigna angularis var. angularis]
MLLLFVSIKSFGSYTAFRRSVVFSCLVPVFFSLTTRPLPAFHRSVTTEEEICEDLYHGPQHSHVKVQMNFGFLINVLGLFLRLWVLRGGCTTRILGLVSRFWVPRGGCTSGVNDGVGCCRSVLVVGRCGLT